jgi:P4 family phage/plasmid primase-like protien
MGIFDHKNDQTNPLNVGNAERIDHLSYKIADARWTVTLTSPNQLSGVVGLVPLTDMDVAEFLYAEMGTEVHYTGAVGWYMWDGTVHKHDATDSVGLAMVQWFVAALERVTAGLLGQISMWPNQQDKDKGFKYLGPITEYLKRIKNAGGMNGLASTLQKYFKVDNNYFDDDLRWLVLRDGMVIDTWQILTPLDEPMAFDTYLPDPKRRVTRKLGVSLVHGLEPGSNPGWFLSLLRKTVSNEEEIKYLQEAAGAAILGWGKAKNIPHLVGPPHTFKSVYLNIMDDVFGDYAGTLPATALVQKTGGGANFSQSRARGIRFLWLSEPQTTKTDDAFLKNLSGGGEPINTEEKGKDSVAWKAQCVLHIAANHVVKFDSRDSAIVSRMNIVEFHNQVREEDINPELANQIVDTEGDEILLWALEGARRYSERGSIMVPDSVKQRAQDNVVESSMPLRWLTEKIDSEDIVVDKDTPAYRCIKLKDAWTSFMQWAEENDERKGYLNKDHFHDEIDNYMGAPMGKRGRKFKAQRTTRIWGLQDVLTASGITEDGGTGQASVKPVEGHRTVGEVFRQEG